MDAADSEVKDAPGGTPEETVIASTEAADSFSDLMDRAFAGERFQVTRYGKGRVYIVGAREYERMREMERRASAAA